MPSNIADHDPALCTFAKCKVQGNSKRITCCRADSSSGSQLSCRRLRGHLLTEILSANRNKSIAHAMAVVVSFILHLLGDLRAGSPIRTPHPLFPRRSGMVWGSWGGCIGRGNPIRYIWPIHWARIGPHNGGSGRNSGSRHDRSLRKCLGVCTNKHSQCRCPADGALARWMTGRDGRGCGRQVAARRVT